MSQTTDKILDSNSVTAYAEYMALFLELFLFLIRLFLLLTGSFVSYIVGTDFYNAVISYGPCREVLAALIGYVPLLFLFYGIFHKKYFWQRQIYFNAFIGAISFLVALVVTVFPVSFLAWLDPLLVYCPNVKPGLPMIAQFLFTGVIISVLAFIGTDFGVSLKHISLRLHTGHQHSVLNKKKPSKPKKKKK